MQGPTLPAWENLSRKTESPAKANDLSLRKVQPTFSDLLVRDSEVMRESRAEEG